MAKRGDNIPNGVARLRGIRLVTASETGDGNRLDESLIKDVTGGDRIAARFMRGEWFEIHPPLQELPEYQLSATDLRHRRRHPGSPAAGPVPDPHAVEQLLARMDELREACWAAEAELVQTCSDPVLLAQMEDVEEQSIREQMLVP